MVGIFISYASENKDRAKAVADVLAGHGWSVWWDREIPLGKSYDDVIEQALAEAQCAIVLWSEKSVSSEWVRNEASEAKRRGILIPAFIEPVAAPLAFRLLNGANLIDWRPGVSHAEFDKLVEHVVKMLESPPSDIAIPVEHYSTPHAPRLTFSRAVVYLGGIALVSMLVGVIYFNHQQENDPEIGMAIPTGIKIPDLGLDIVFMSGDQAQQMGIIGKSLHAGAVVRVIESDKPAGMAGLQAGDSIFAIGGKQIASLDDLRQAVRDIGPGKTDFSFRRGGDTMSVKVSCPQCKAE